MIERNIGNVERVVRLLLALNLLAWVVIQPHLNIIEWFVLIVSVMMVLNGVFSRCYLWYVLDINTCSSNDRDCLHKKESCY